jgi:hypothetical protein
VSNVGLIQFNTIERAELAKQIAGQGGFQVLMKRLRQRAAISGKLTLSDDEIAQIGKYAFYESGGGYENRLRVIFQRTLGSKLNGYPDQA